MRLGANPRRGRALGLASVAVAAIATALAVAGCSGANPTTTGHAAPSLTVAARTTGEPTGRSGPPLSGGAISSTSLSAGATATGAPTAVAEAVAAMAPPAPQLPRGGRTILPAYRVVAYYGGPNGPALGVLGSADPDTIAARIEQRAAQYAPFGRTIQPAMELIATVARPCGAAFPQCTGAIDDADIQRYLDAAHRHKLLLILDFQPGRGEFLPQVRADERFLTDPSVSVALDPEWKLGPHEYPMQVIGSSSAASVNAVGSYLSALVKRLDLPDKLLIVHEFRLSMLPDRQNIAVQPGLENVIHADGFGTVGDKMATWNNLAIAAPFHAGFKLFLTQDTNMLSPSAVMALTPQPDLITYQ